ncbi:hypothetical protein COOONC_18841 [Cooperia oncophora]
MRGRGLELLNDVIASGEAPSEEDALPLARKLGRVLLGEEKWSPEICSERLAKSILVFLTDAARANWPVDILEIEVDCDHSLFKAVLKVYEEIVADLRTMLETVGWDYPELVNFEWSVRNIVQTELVNRVSEPVVSFKLHVLPVDDPQWQPVEFHCDINQFQDLHSKVKEAMNILEQLKAYKGTSY